MRRGVKDGQARFDLRAEAMPIEELALERREEALTQRVVVRVADAADRRPDALRGAALAEGDRRVLAALVGVKNHVRRSALRHGHVQRREDQLRRRCVSIAPGTTRRLHASTTIPSASRSVRGPWRGLASCAIAMCCPVTHATCVSSHSTQADHITPNSVCDFTL